MIPTEGHETSCCDHMLQSIAQLLNPEGGTLPTTDGQVPVKSLRLQLVPEFLLKMYTWFRHFFFHFKAFWKPCPREISYVDNVANLKNDIVYYLVDFYCFEVELIVKYDLI